MTVLYALTGASFLFSGYCALSLKRNPRAFAFASSMSVTLALVTAAAEHFLK